MSDLDNRLAVLLKAMQLLEKNDKHPMPKAGKRYGDGEGSGGQVSKGKGLGKEELCKACGGTKMVKGSACPECCGGKKTLAKIAPGSGPGNMGRGTSIGEGGGLAMAEMAPNAKPAKPPSGNVPGKPAKPPAPPKAPGMVKDEKDPDAPPSRQMSDEQRAKFTQRHAASAAADEADSRRADVRGRQHQIRSTMSQTRKEPFGQEMVEHQRGRLASLKRLGKGESDKHEFVGLAVDKDYCKTCRERVSHPIHAVGYSDKKRPRTEERHDIDRNPVTAHGHCRARKSESALFIRGGAIRACGASAAAISPNDLDAGAAHHLRGLEAAQLRKSEPDAARHAHACSIYLRLGGHDPQQGIPEHVQHLAGALYKSAPPLSYVPFAADVAANEAPLWKAWAALAPGLLKPQQVSEGLKGKGPAKLPGATRGAFSPGGGKPPPVPGKGLAQQRQQDFGGKTAAGPAKPPKMPGAPSGTPKPAGPGAPKAPAAAKPAGGPPPIPKDAR